MRGRLLLGDLLRSTDALAENAIAEAHAAGAEVTDTKELAEEVTMTAVHDMQHAHAVAELEALIRLLMMLLRSPLALVRNWSSTPAPRRSRR